MRDHLVLLQVSNIPAAQAVNVTKYQAAQTSLDAEVWAKLYAHCTNVLPHSKLAHDRLAPQAHFIGHRTQCCELSLTNLSVLSCWLYQSNLCPVIQWRFQQASCALHCVHAGLCSTTPMQAGSSSLTLTFTACGCMLQAPKLEHS